MCSGLWIVGCRGGRGNKGGLVCFLMQFELMPYSIVYNILYVRYQGADFAPFEMLVVMKVICWNVFVINKVDIWERGTD